jgi:hypothetical protein
MRALYERWWLGRKPGERAGAVALAVAVLLGLGALWLAQTEPDPDVSETAEQAAGRRCSEVRLPASGRVECRSDDATLTVATEDTPVLFDDTDVRVYEAALDGEELRVRLRIRNKTTGPQPANADGRQFEVDLPSGRISSEPPRAPLTIAPGEAETLDVRFALTPQEAAEARGRDTVGLRVLPFSQLGEQTPSRLGEIRLRLGEGERSGGTSAEPPVPTSGIPPCSEIDPDQRQSGRVTCNSATATLTIADQDTPILLSEMDVRAYSAALSGSELTVRLRVRNKTDRNQIIEPGGRQWYLNLQPDRVYAGTRRAVIEPGTAEVVDLTFALDAAEVAQVRSRGGVVGLGIVPFQELDDPQPGRLGVIRLSVALA